ncbi:hypothetical protein ACNAN0_01280 [Agrilactobacillus fermenti]|uniref:hypothetical protein n=1 Tax=Agrilactobacillus fermenti TaxID=2586909 RepID=UPI003A5BE995
MKKSSVKYLGVAAAALLAVAPLAAPALSATTEPAQVQAATTTGLPQFVFDTSTPVKSGTTGYTSIGNNAYQEVKASSDIYLGSNPTLTSLDLGSGAAPYLSVKGAFYNVDTNQNGNGQFFVPVTKYWEKAYSVSGNIQSKADNPIVTVYDSYENNLKEGNATLGKIRDLLHNGSITVKAAYQNPAKTETYFAFTYNGATYFVQYDDSEITFAQGANVSDVAGTATTNQDDTATYTDAKLAYNTGALVRDKGTKLSVTKVAKDSNGNATAYFVEDKSANGNAAGKWVSASDVTFSATTAAKVTTKSLPAGTVLYSKDAATIYSDAATSKDSGKKLATDVTEWRAFEEALNDNGDVVAYRLGTNQWVKASDLAAQKDKDGVFATAKGTTLYTSDGDKAGSVQADGVYRVYAERHINGKQALKLGTDSQWVYAENGSYYPA